MEPEEAFGHYFCAAGEEKDLEGVCDEVCRLELNENESESFEMFDEDGEDQVIKTKLRLCRTEGCDGCKNLHLCKSYLFGECPHDNEGDECPFSHDLYSEHNVGVLCEHKLLELDFNELCITLLQNDTALLPEVCWAYNEGGGEFGNCPEAESCEHLHICEDYIRGTCDGGSGCGKCHDLYEPHPAKTLQDSGVPNQLMDILVLIYRNMLTIADVNRPDDFSSAEENWICLLHFRNSCLENSCEDVHFCLPYKWEQRHEEGWELLADNEEVEKAFSDPNNTHSRGVAPVHYESMTRGFAAIRRLSTISSVLDPSFALTTTWIWYREDEDGKWVRYGSSEETRDTGPVTSEYLEWKYQENPRSVIKFSADERLYEIDMQDMTQRSEQIDSARVRRRPAFLSAEDVRNVTTRETESKDHRAGGPRDSDQAAASTSGFERILLSGDCEEYQKVLKRFNETMSEFKVKSIEKVLNKDSWEAFQRHVGVMKGRENEKRLFLGTQYKHMETICKQNVDWRISEACMVTPYGKGIYFSEDARSSHSITDTSGTRCMFLCRVLVGEYTVGDRRYNRAPLKDGVFYDSCVNDMNNPCVFVVFEKHQVYPEYLIQYQPGARRGPRPRFSRINQARVRAPSQSGPFSTPHYFPRYRHGYNTSTSAPIAASLMAPVFRFPSPRVRSAFSAQPNSVGVFPFPHYYRPFLPRNFTVRNPTRPQMQQGGFGPLRPPGPSAPGRKHHGPNSARGNSGFGSGSASTSTSAHHDDSKSVRGENAKAKRASGFNSRPGSGPEVQSMKPEGKSFKSSDIQSTKPEGRTSRSSDAQSTKPAGKTSRRSSSQSTKPAGKTSRRSSSQSRRPAGKSS